MAYTIHIVCKRYQLFKDKFFKGCDIIRVSNLQNIRGAIFQAEVCCPLLHELSEFKEEKRDYHKADIIHKDTKQVNGYIEIYPSE